MLNFEMPLLADSNESPETLERQKLTSLKALESLLLFKPDQLAKFVADVPVITDDHPYTEFPFWRSIFEPAYRSWLTFPIETRAASPNPERSPNGAK